MIPFFTLPLPIHPLQSRKRQVCFERPRLLQLAEKRTALVGHGFCSLRKNTSNQPTAMVSQKITNNSNKSTTSARRAARFTPQQEARALAAQTSTQFDPQFTPRYCPAPFWKRTQSHPTHGTRSACYAVGPKNGALKGTAFSRAVTWRKMSPASAAAGCI